MYKTKFHDLGKQKNANWDGNRHVYLFLSSRSSGPISRPFAWKMMFQTTPFENRVFVVGGGLKGYDRMGIVCTDVFVT
jgi:hypothetical protein